MMVHGSQYSIAFLPAAPRPYMVFAVEMAELSCSFSLRTSDFRIARRRVLTLVLQIETIIESTQLPKRAELEGAIRRWIDNSVWRQEIRRAETGGLDFLECHAGSRPSITTVVPPMAAPFQDIFQGKGAPSAHAILRTTRALVDNSEETISLCVKNDLGLPFDLSAYTPGHVSDADAHRRRSLSCLAASASPLRFFVPQKQI